jgi:hypothetical protein
MRRREAVSLLVSGWGKKIKFQFSPQTYGFSEISLTLPLKNKLFCHLWASAFSVFSTSNDIVGFDLMTQFFWFVAFIDNLERF